MPFRAAPTGRALYEATISKGLSDIHRYGVFRRMGRDRGP